MAQLAGSRVSLRIFGDHLFPDEISKLLGCEPTQAWRKGQVVASRDGQGITRKTGAWFLRAEPAEPEDLDGQVASLLKKMSTDLSAWAVVGTQYKMDLFCGLFMGGSNEGLSVSAETLRRLGERGVELSLDIYCPDDSISESASQRLRDS